MRARLDASFEVITSLENLLVAWEEFTRGKKQRKDVQEFGFHLMDNLTLLHDDLVSFRYRHGGYQAFSIADPKPRSIHKASVRDRVLHHTLYRVLYPFFDRTFVSTSFSCRVGRGTHAALQRFASFARRVSRNHTRTCWVLKMDIVKFFANIDHTILSDILASYIPDERTRALLGEVVGSFSSTAPGVGLPLGNLTSQLLVNVYMNEFDQFVKHDLKAKYYIRYADDFVLLSDHRTWLENQIERIALFLTDRLRLTLHPDKIVLKSVASGVDFLGWVHFPHYRILRTATKRRMFRHLKERSTPEALHSYLGLMSHGQTFTLQEEVVNTFGLWAGRQEMAADAENLTFSDIF